jgi:hypothetical protein
MGNVFSRELSKSPGVGPSFLPSCVVFQCSQIGDRDVAQELTRFEVAGRDLGLLRDADSITIIIGCFS